MDFDFTPDEARTIAEFVARALKRQKFSIQVEVSYHEDAPYRTTLTATRHDLTILIEAQREPTYGSALKDLVAYLALKRANVELSVATSESASVAGSLMTNLKRAGVGLLIVTDEGRLEKIQAARNPALLVTPDPTLKYGKCKLEVEYLVSRFNDGDRKDSLRDMCEAVERETDQLLRRLNGKGWVTLRADQIDSMNWQRQLDVLASSKGYSDGRNPVLDSSDKTDLESFKGARNLLDHKVKNKREEARRQRQYVERMMQGARLIARLVALQRRIR